MFGLIVGLMWLALFVAGIAGWFMNIFDLIAMADVAMQDITLMFVLRIVGIFVFPLGALLGWF